MNVATVTSSTIKFISLVLLLTFCTLYAAPNAALTNFFNPTARKLGKMFYYLNAPSLKETLTNLKKELAIHPNDPALLYQKAVVYMNINRYKIALDTIKQLRHRDSSNNDYLKLESKLNQLIASTKKKLIALNKLLKQQPKSNLLRMQVIELQLSLGNYKNALSEIKIGLAYDPKQTDLLYQQLLIYIDIGNYKAAQKTFDILSTLTNDIPDQENLKILIAANNKSIKKQPSSAIASSEKPPLKRNTELELLPTRQHNFPESDLTDQNMISLNTLPVMVKDRNLKQTWFYNNIFYGRKEKKIDYFVGANQSIRGNQNGYQFYAELYPKINRYLYFHLNYNYSKSTLYPRHFAGIMANLSLPQEVLVSLGAKYRDIVGKDLWAYDIWFSKFFGQHWFAVKPTVFTSKTSPTVAYLVGTYRYYFSLPNHYLALSAGYGSTPDLLDLNAQGFVIIKAWNIFGSYQFPVTKRLFASLGTGYMHEIFPSGLMRKKVMLFASITKYF